MNGWLLFPKLHKWPEDPQGYCTHCHAVCCILLMSGFRTQRAGTQGDASNVASDASRTIYSVLVPKKRLGSDATPRQRLRRLNSGQEIWAELCPVQPGDWEPASISPVLGLSGTGGSFPWRNPSLARVPDAINLHFWAILSWMVND